MYFEKIMHFEKKISKCMKFGTKSMHFEIFQNMLNLGPSQHTLKNIFKVCL